MNTQIVTVSTKGQVALPVAIRREMGIENGDKFIAFSYGDTIMLKKLELPTADVFRKAMDEAKDWAKQNGVTENDVDAVIKESRREKR